MENMDVKFWTKDAEDSYEVMYAWGRTCFEAMNLEQTWTVQ